MCVGEFSRERDTSGGGETGGDRGHAQVQVGGCCGNPSHATAKPAGGGDSEASIARLMRTIEGEIVPRLVLARRAAKTTAAAQSGAGGKPDDADVMELVRLLLGKKPSGWLAAREESAGVSGIHKEPGRPHRKQPRLGVRSDTMNDIPCRQRKELS